MINSIKTIAAALALALIAVEAQAAGTVAGEEFFISLGARPSALGDAYTSVATGALAAYWNPAGLGDLRYQEVSFTHLQWFEGVTFDSVAYALPLVPGESIGICLNKMASTPISMAGETPATDPSYPLPSLYSPSPDSYNLSSFFGELSYGKHFFHTINVGITVKYLQESFQDIGFKGYGFDVGAILRPFAGSSSLGVAVQNIGPAISGYSLPLLVKLGAAKKFNIQELEEMTGGQPDNIPKQKDILATADVSYDTVGQDMGFHFGVDYSPRFGSQGVSLRAGFSTQMSLPILFTVGLGYILDFQAIQMILDYAYVPYSNLGDSHRITLTLDF